MTYKIFGAKRTMKHLEKIDFLKEAFPIKIIPRRASFVGTVDTATQAFHEAVEIKYFYEGESTVLIDTETVHAVAGDIIVINPYEFHTTIDCGKDNPGKYHLFMIGLDFFEGAVGADINLRKLLLENRVAFKSKISENKKIRDILSRAVCEYERGDAHSGLALFGLIAELFAELLREAEAETKKSSVEGTLGYYAIIEPAIRLIRDGYSESFTVERLACACRISKYHFCRIFKAATGVSAIQYLNSYRLKIADTMLQNTSRTVSEVASLCGFDDVSYFSRIYKKHFNETPVKAKGKTK